MNHASSICVYTLISRAWGHYFVEGPSHLRDQLAFKTHSLLFNNIQFSEEVTGKLGKTALKKAYDAYKAAFFDPRYQAAIQRCIIHAKISQIATQITPFFHHHLYLQPEIFDDDSLLEWIKQYAHTIDPTLNLGRPVHFNPDFEIETPQGQKPELIGFYAYMYGFPLPNVSGFYRNEQELLARTAGMAFEELAGTIQFRHSPPMDSQFPFRYNAQLRWWESYWNGCFDEMAPCEKVASFIRAKRRYEPHFIRIYPLFPAKQSSEVKD
ncbi:hypothetical protein [Corynebacterium pseudodiphtheriticum]|uniref:Uncharacterized protein n=1 Tax=Corynebacterium pseudodiphtheriticum TaxID=37637 RepID=A0AAP4F4T6_9CORY|nr:hypothetical protein [Corynebacterium pseudodiphtheriticum]MDK4228471.1 hypothetical protein [Corynebacterium pseudodiphtheriticum]MDK4306656.1 hypothetical protein [Corynebacterium pseudodiphtheriticum]